MLVMHQHKSCLAIYQIVGCIKCRRFDYELKAFYLKCKDIYLRKSFLSPFQNTRPLANSYSKFAESLLQICGKFKIRMQINFWQTVCRKFRIRMQISFWQTVCGKFATSLQINITALRYYNKRETINKH